jgi:hypothetical protein
MCDVVPRVIEVGDIKTFAYWYNAAPICIRCEKAGHPVNECREPPPRPMRQGPSRSINERARRRRPTPPAPAAPTSPRAAPSSSRGSGNSNAQLASVESTPATEGRTADAGSRRTHGAAAATNHLEPPPPGNTHPEPENTSDAATVETSDECDTAAPSEASGDEGQSPATNNQPESEPELELDATPMETGDACDTPTPAAALEDEDQEDLADRETSTARDDERTDQHSAPPAQIPTDERPKRLLPRAERRRRSQTEKPSRR